MKKSIRIASILLALVLVTSCFVGGTFAKYVTTGPDATDSARVAKWGVKIEATGVMFNDSYKNEFTDYTVDEEGRDITVQADVEGTNVVAPGTEGDLAAIKVTGTPEVDTEITYEADLELTGWGDYCPLEITVGTETFKGVELGAAGLEAAVEAAIVAKTAIYDTNTDLSVVNDDVVVSWAWKFEGNDDVKDTALGDAAAAGNAATVALTLTATATQVD